MPEPYDTIDCDHCGKPTPVNLIDAKPNIRHWSVRQLQRAADTGRSFTFNACRACYGPGWMPMGEAA